MAVSLIGKTPWTTWYQPWDDGSKPSPPAKPTNKTMKTLVETSKEIIKRKGNKIDIYA